MTIKRTIQSIFLLAGAVMMTACGGSGVKLSPEAEEIFAEAEGGLFDNEQLDIMRQCVKKWELKRESQETDSLDRIAKLEEEANAAQAQWEERSQTLNGITVPTEVADGLPVKLATPFTLKALAHSVQMLATLKFTTDRPGVKDKDYHQPDFYKIMMVTLDGGGQPIDTIALGSTTNFYAERDFAAGDELEVEAYINFKNLEKARSILKAKKLLIIWEHPIQEKMPDTVHGDLGIFNLRGPVESCKWKGLYDTWTLYFDSEGHWKGESGRGTFNRFGTTKRDNQGRIVELTNGDESLVYEYNADGLLKKHVAQYMDGVSESTYEYDENGDCIKEISTYGGMDMEEGEGPTISSYTVTARDNHGNWTERKDQKGNTERRTITYMP